MEAIKTSNRIRKERLIKTAQDENFQYQMECLDLIDKANKYNLMDLLQALSYKYEAIKENNTVISLAKG